MEYGVGVFETVVVVDWLSAEGKEVTYRDDMQLKTKTMMILLFEYIF